MGDLISRQAAIDALKPLPTIDGLGLQPLVTVDDAIKVLNNLPSVQPVGKDINVSCKDAISRQAAIRWVKTECNPYGKPTLDFESGKRVMEHLKTMPSVHPTYTDAEVQKIQDMEQAEIEKAFDLGREDAMAEIVRCKDCRWQKDQSGSTAWLPCRVLVTPDDFYCGRAERRTDGEIIPE